MFATLVRLPVAQQAGRGGTRLPAPSLLQSCGVAIIDVDSFGFTYSGTQRPAVHDVSFTVEQGEIVGCLGPSGAGKSTTQNVLVRLLDGYQGSVTVLGRNLRAWDRSYYRRISERGDARHLPEPATVT